MVGCDNPDCDIEWFHFGCVGITENVQKGKWFCPSCRIKLGLENPEKKVDKVESEEDVVEV